jgi:hypothetical protein
VIVAQLGDDSDVSRFARTHLNGRSRRQLEEVLSKFGEKVATAGRPSIVFHLPKDLTITLVAGYSATLRHRIVRRWMELIIADIAVHQDDGRYNLNDLHKAAGGEKRHFPNYWLTNDKTQGLAAEVSNNEIPAINSKRGRYGGTFVVC